MQCGDLEIEEKEDYYVEDRNWYFSTGPLVTVF
jgi:hypothetical protein